MKVLPIISVYVLFFWILPDFESSDNTLFNFGSDKGQEEISMNNRTNDDKDIVSRSTCNSTNLVRNPSFEDRICASGSVGCGHIGGLSNNGIDGARIAEHWNHYSGSPDYYDENSVFTGAQTSYEGNAHIGLYTLSGIGQNGREYVGTELTSPLVVGNTYKVSFMVSLNEDTFNQPTAINKLGARFYTNPVANSNSSNFPVPNNAQVYEMSIIHDTDNWVKVSGTFTANDPYTHLLLGNFFDDTNTDYAQNGGGYAYHYIDMVEVYDVTGTSQVEAGTDMTINEGEQITLFGTPNGGVPTYLWRATPSDISLVDITSQSPAVSPEMTTTYTVTADFGGGCIVSDSVTITVLASSAECASDNLVRNPSFEDKICEPMVSSSDCAHTGLSNNAGISGARIAEYWNHYSWSPDFYDPNSFSWGNQDAYDGEAYVGLYGYQPSGIREYIGTELITPLEVGRQYRVSFQISRNEASSYPNAVSNMGATFYMNPQAQPNNTNFQVPNTAAVFETSIISESDSWVTVSGIYTADQAYTHVLLGNFFDNSMTDQAANGSAYYFIDMVEVNVIDSNNQVDAGPDMTINLGDRTTLTATPGAGSPTYLWTASPADSSLTDSTEQNPEISPGQTTTYTVTADFGGCTDTDTVTVFVGACPLLLDDSGITYTGATCNQTNGSITGILINGVSGSETYSWTDGNGTEVGTMLDLVNVGPGSYDLTVTDGVDCNVSGNYIVNETESPDLDDANIQLIDADCGLTNGSITGIVYIGDGNGAVFEWTDANGMSVGNIIDLTGMGAGSYTLTVTNTMGCGAVVGPFAISELAAPILDQSTLAVNDQACDANDGGIMGITVLNPTGNETFRWTDADNAIVGDSPDLQNVRSGIYTLMVTDNGCSSIAGPFTINQSCRALDGLRIANTMTPNGDGANDTFIIEGLENYPGHSLYIYNRWGSKLYQSWDYDNSWGGTFEGRPLPVATYYYILELNDLDRRRIKGYINVLR